MAPLLFSCNTTDPGEPPEVRPPGYQEDIPWPSLADSPWPMAAHDPQGTGRSNLTVVLNGEIDIRFEAVNHKSGVVVNGNNEIIFAGEGVLYCYRPDGQLMWKTNLGESGEMLMTPLVSADGSIISANSSAGKLYAVDNQGTILWVYNSGADIWQKSVVIDMAGNIYFVDSSSRLHCLNKGGQSSWTFQYSRFNGYSGTSCTISPGGDKLYIPGINTSIICFDIGTQVIDWIYGYKTLNNSPVTDSAGNIYFLTGNDVNGMDTPTMVSLDPSGAIRWEYTSSNYSAPDIKMNTPTIDFEGNLYFAYDSLYSLDYSGNLRWKKELLATSDCPLVCDASGTIFCGSMSAGLGSGIAVEAFDKKGELLWQLVDNNNYQVGGSPAIIKNGLLFPTWRSNNILLIR